MATKETDKFEMDSSQLLEQIDYFRWNCEFDKNTNAKLKIKNSKSLILVNSTTNAISSRTDTSRTNVSRTEVDWWFECLARLKAEFLRRWENPIQQNASLDEFRMSKTLGSGSFGRVILVKHIVDQEFYAMKMLIKEKVVKTNQVEHTLNEKRVLQAIDFPFWVKLYFSFQDPSNLYLVLGFENGGEMFTHLRKAKKFNEPTARFYCAQVIMAFEYLHNMDILYRDLKPENMLITMGGYTKVTDLGFAKQVPPELRTYTLCGTPEYLAPEVIKHKGYGKSVDWWTVGVLIFEMTAGNVPFYSKDHAEMYAKIVKGAYRCPDYFSKELVDLVKNLLQNDISKRHGCLKGGVSDIKRHSWFSDLNWKDLYEREIKPPFMPDVKGNGDSSYFHAQKTEEHIHISAVDKYRSLFRDF